jgi:hypothetical protein
MTTSVFDFNVLEGNGRGVTDKKWADQRILDRYAVVELRATVQEETSVHIQQFQ